MDSKKKIKLDDESRIIIKFQNDQGEALPQQLDLPINSTVLDLHKFLNEMLENEEEIPYSFYFNSVEIKKSIQEFIKKLENFSSEKVFPITYHPQALFFVKPITRWSSSLEGHTDAVLCTQFSPDGKSCASGSGDSTIRLWDIETETPEHTIDNHKNWVLCLQFSPNNKYIASGDVNGFISVHQLDSKTNTKLVKAHKQFITSISWEPLHRNFESNLFVTGSKDGQSKIYSTQSMTCQAVLNGHQASVTKVLWGGQDFIYTGSEDRSVRVFKKSGQMIRELKGHGHWVNTLAVHTDYCLKTGCYERGQAQELTIEYAQKRYDKLKGKNNERLVSGSDDFSLIIWDPVKNAKPQYRLTGHQGAVNHISFSPDGRFIVSGAFDKSLKLWDGYNGTFIANFRGHVGAIYQVAWSVDSRLFLSGSKDSTLKVWDLKTKKLMFDLPGHSDEIYAVDWSPDGEKVISGGKDKLIKIWKN